jgi:hypothetical protein
VRRAAVTLLVLSGRSPSLSRRLVMSSSRTESAASAASTQRARTLYASDLDGRRVRRIDPVRRVTTVAR